jgi:hypothetical protein
MSKDCKNFQQFYQALIFPSSGEFLHDGRRRDSVKNSLKRFNEFSDVSYMANTQIYDVITFHLSYIINTGRCSETGRSPYNIHATLQYKVYKFYARYIIYTHIHTHTYIYIYIYIRAVSRVRFVFRHGRAVIFKAFRFTMDKIYRYERRYHEPQCRFHRVPCVCELPGFAWKKGGKKKKNDSRITPMISPRRARRSIFDPLSKFGPGSPSTFMRRVPCETVDRYLPSFLSRRERCPQGGHLYVLRGSFDGLAGFAVPETDTKGEPQRTRMDAPLTRVRFQWPRRD